MHNCTYRELLSIQSGAQGGRNEQNGAAAYLSVAEHRRSLRFFSTSPFTLVSHSLRDQFAVQQKFGIANQALT